MRWQPAGPQTNQAHLPDHRPEGGRGAAAPVPPGDAARSRIEFEIKVISLADEGPVGEQLRAAGIPVLACGARSARDWRALGRLWRFLLSDPPDILHALLVPCQYRGTAGRAAGRRSGLANPLRDSDGRGRAARGTCSVDRLTCRLCRCEIANSPSVLEHLHRRARIPRQRLRCEWGAVDTQAIAAAAPADRASLGVAPEENLSCGRAGWTRSRGSRRCWPPAARLARIDPIQAGARGRRPVPADGRAADRARMGCRSASCCWASDRMCRVC